MDFGYQLVNLLGIKGLSIKIATSLPDCDNQNIAFRNSYRYYHAEKCLYIHANKISSSGDFGMILLHALSHIKVKFTFNTIFFIGVQL